MRIDKTKIKTLKIRNPWLINPFLYFAGFWTIAFIMFLVSPSKSTGTVNIGLAFFVIITIISSWILSYFFNRIFNNKTIIVKPENTSFLGWLILIFAYVAEFVYSGGSPLISALIGAYEVSYDEFGIPTIHVIIVTYSLYYCVKHIFLFSVFREKNYLISLLIPIAFFAFIYARGMILFVSVAGIALLLLDKRIKLKYILITIVIGLFVAWLFGILGNIRVGGKWNDSSYLLMIANIDADKNGLLTPLFWVEEYIASPIRALNYNINSFDPTYSIVDFIFYIIPDFIAKRIFEKPTSTLVMLQYGFTVKTMYEGVYASLDFIGMIYLFLQYLLVAFVIIGYKFKIEFTRITCFAILSILFGLSIFDNMLSYSGYSFAIIWGLLSGYVHIPIRHIKIRLRFKRKPWV